MYKKFREEWHHICIPVNKTAWASFNHNNFFKILRREIYFVSQSSSQHNIHSFFYLFFYPLSPLLCVRSHLHLLFSRSVVSYSLQPHGLQHTSLPCPSLFPRVSSNWYSLIWWCYPTISFSVPLPLLLLPSSIPSIRVFSSESILCIRWPKYWSFSFSISPSNVYSGLIFFRID